MPSMTAYSSYETLAFFKSVATHGIDASAFRNISEALLQDEFIRSNENFSTGRLSVGALQRLYEETISAEKNAGDARVNGNTDSGERSPKRRKLSASSSSGYDVARGDKHLVEGLLDKLYTKYKDEVIKEICREEEVYAQAEATIKTLEQEVEAENVSASQQQSQAAVSTVEESKLEVESDHSREPKSDKLDAAPAPLIEAGQSAAIEPEVKPQAIQSPAQSSPAPPSGIHRQVTQGPAKQSPLPSPSELPTARPTIPASQSRGSQPPTAHQSPSSFNRTLLPPSPQHPTYGQLPGQGNYVQGHQPSPGPMIPHGIGVQQRPPNVDPTKRPPSGLPQGRVSPMPPQQQQQHHQYPYPPYTPYPPQWHPHMTPPQYSQHSPYGPPPQYYPQPLPPGRYPGQVHTPQQHVPYPPYPHTAPVQYMPPQPWRGQPHPGHPMSAASTPLSRPGSARPALKSGSSTPWKKKFNIRTPRPVSPTRPERAVSPLSDRGSPAPERPTKTQKGITAGKKVEDDAPSQLQPPSSRRGRRASQTPSAVEESRSQSLASRISDTTVDRPNIGRRAKQIKAEIPSTPVGATSDTDQSQQRSSSRRGRSRNSTITSHPDLYRSNTTVKRKRETISPTPSLQSREEPAQTPSSRRLLSAHDPNSIVVSKNFARTSQLLLNDITSHKLAGIFAKPLSERDAPGYKDLVLRPQDLKSIKAAISKGGRAALASIEAIEGNNNNNNDSDATPIGSNSTVPPTNPTNNNSTSVGPIGNGFYLVPKTLDLLPPKGIVNSAQLEMELTRMFANAVMFNPLPTSERGFGRALRLRRNKPTTVDNNRLRRTTAHTPNTENNSPQEDESSSSTSEESEQIKSSNFTYEGGIISDAREMFEDVAASVGKWRSLEGERMGYNTSTATSSSSLGLNFGVVGGSGGGSDSKAFLTPNISATGVSAQQQHEPSHSAATLRHASVSASSNLGEDDTVLAESGGGGATNTGKSSRKRRRITTTASTAGGSEH